MRKLQTIMMAAIFAASSGLAFATKNAGEGNATARQAPSSSQQHTPATPEYKRAKKRIKADYQSDKSVCNGKTGEAQTQCIHQAKARKKQAMADARKANENAQPAQRH